MFSAVRDPEAGHRRHNLALVLEVLTSDFLKQFACQVHFCVSFPMKTNISVHFFPLGGWMGGQKSLLLLQQAQTTHQ